ncbi:hypothetical protein DIPPA_12424 [Diplonema papillatum]|nr:hypothetical protein DIPPA_12424 [Diplonema papillatum]
MAEQLSMQQLVARRRAELQSTRHGTRRRRVKLPQAQPPPLTLPNEKSLLDNVVEGAVSAATTHEFWIAAAMGNFIHWCQSQVASQRQSELQRKRWMKRNNLTYDDLRAAGSQQWMDRHGVSPDEWRHFFRITFEVGERVHALRDIDLPLARKTAAKGSIGYVTRLSSDAAGPDVKFRYRLPDHTYGWEIVKTGPQDTEPCERLLQWGWRPVKAHDHSSSEDSE